MQADQARKAGTMIGALLVTVSMVSGIFAVADNQAVSASRTYDAEVAATQVVQPERITVTAPRIVAHRPAGIHTAGAGSPQRYLR